jgi:hypothetical protein
VVLEKMPLSVNIKFHRDDVHLSESMTLEQGDFVVPFTCGHQGKFKMQEPGSSRHRPREAIHNMRDDDTIDIQTSARSFGRKQPLKTYNYFFHGFELAFAVTYFKLQGLTLDKLILDFSSTGSPKIDISSVYVGISRVRHPSNLRKLPLSTETRRQLNMETFNPKLVKWWNGCHDQNVTAAHSQSIPERRKAIADDEEGYVRLRGRR